jgi:hypothetical protein
VDGIDAGEQKAESLVERDDADRALRVLGIIVVRFSGIGDDETIPSGVKTTMDGCAPTSTGAVSKSPSRSKNSTDPGLDLVGP